jgi:hypothetical protein
MYNPAFKKSGKKSWSIQVPVTCFILDENQASRQVLKPVVIHLHKPVNVANTPQPHGGNGANDHHDIQGWRKTVMQSYLNL